MAVSRRTWMPGVLGIFAVVAATTTGCSGTTADDHELVVYSAQQTPLVERWSQAFTKQTGIRVVVRDGADLDLAAQVVAEGAHSPADVLLTDNPPAMTTVDRAGLLADVGADALAGVPDRFRATSGHWIGVAARSTVFVTAPGALEADRVPASLLDLQQPPWRGRWGADPAGADFRTLVAALLQVKGEAVTRAWLRGVRQNAVPSDGDAGTLRQVENGGVDGAVLDNGSWYHGESDVDQHGPPPVPHYFPPQDPGSFISIAAGGVLKSSHRQDAARQFLRFLTSAPGQQVLRDGPFAEYPVAAGMAANPTLPPWDSLRPPAVDPNTLDSAQADRLLTETGLLPPNSR